MNKLLIPLALVLISCGNNPTYIYTPPAKDGVNGYNAMINIINSAPTCPSGGITLVSGTDSNYDGTITSLDENVQTATICNGVNGTNGSNGTNGTNGINGVDASMSPYTPVNMIAPCGNTIAYKEQLMCLYNGQVLAAFSDNQAGYNTRLAFITAGSFMDTDGSNCLFNVSINSGSTTVSWTGGSYTCQKH